MNYKKLIIILLIVSILATSSVGCAKKKAKDSSAPPEQSIPNTPEQSQNDISNSNNAQNQLPNTSQPSTPNNTQNQNQNQNNNNITGGTNTNTNNTPSPDASSKDTLSFESNGNGTCTLVGIGSYTDACLVVPEKNSKGESVTSIAEKAFYSCPTLTAVQIPASVKHIGELAFGDCANLIYIGVNSSNTSYKDISGVLYSFDGTELISYPAAKAGTYTTIDDNVEKIHSMAFYACKYLRTVYYAGDYADWDEISVGSKNYSLTAASIQYSVNGK